VLDYKKIDAKVLLFCRNLDQLEIQRLPFKKSVFSGIENSWLVEQHFAQKVAMLKISEWNGNEKIIFPDKLSVEQSSSGWIAKWKSSLVPENTELLIDGTAGLGVDCFYLGQKVNHVVAFEIDKSRAAILEHNLNALNLRNFDVINAGFEEVISLFPITNPERTLVYLDPDRRPDLSQKANSWEKSEPDLLLIFNILKEMGTHFLVKLSPMDNPWELVSKMEGVSQIFVVSLHLEVKEVLVYWDFASPTKPPEFAIVEIQRSGIFAKIIVSDLHLENQNLGKPVTNQYLYDPWPALRKGFMAKHCLGSDLFMLLSPEAQLFASVAILENVPARIFRILEVVDSFSLFSKNWKGKRLNVISRNFFASAEEIKKRNGFLDGGENYLFCYQSIDKQNVYILTEKVANQYSEAFWQNF